MLPIIDKLTIQFIVEEAVTSGIEEIIVVTGKSKRSIEDHFDSAPELEAYLEEKGTTTGKREDLRVQLQQLAKELLKEEVHESGHFSRRVRHTN